MSGSDEIPSFHFVAGDVSADRLAFNKLSSVLYTEVQYAERMLSGLQERDIIDRNSNIFLPVVVQLIGVNLGILGVVQTVIDLERTSFDTHFFVKRFGGVVVVIVILMRRNPERIVVHSEDGRTEEVGVGTDRVLEYQRNGYLFVLDILASHRFLTVITDLHAIPELGAGDVYRVMVGNRIGLVVVHRVVVEYRYKVVMGGVAQIERLARLAVPEKRGVAASRRLRDLVPYREYIHGILARPSVRIDGDAFLLKERSRGVYSLEKRVSLRVVLQVYDLRDVVSFEFEDHLQIIPQVVGTQPMTERFGSLDVTTCQTSDQTHFGLVVDTDPVKSFT